MDDINGAVPQDERLRLTRKYQKAAAIRPLMAVGFAAGTPHWSDIPPVGPGRFVWRKAASIGEVLRSPSTDGVSFFDGDVEVPGEYDRTEVGTGRG